MPVNVKILLTQEQKKVLCGNILITPSCNDEYGVPAIGYGENIFALARGQVNLHFSVSPEDMSIGDFKCRMGSGGHKRNILSKTYKSMAASVYCGEHTATGSLQVFFQ